MKNLEKPARKYSVPAVNTAFRIITLLSRKKYQKSTLTQIANALDLNPTTCFRILQELQEQSIVKYDEQSKRYILGPYLVVLGERAKEFQYDLSIIDPYLEKITRETGLTSLLVSKVRSDRTAIVSKVEDENFGVKISVGRHFDLLDGAYGKCIMAYANEADAEYYFNSNERIINTSPEDFQALKNELIEVKKNGFAISYDETIRGIFGVAAPIMNFNNQVDLSIAVVGMCAQYKVDELQPIVDVITEYSKKITLEINKRYKEM
ncbi:hypothetical protein SporoP37_07230 [Sporosarcina sp. P37]|uniref:IclR family transcriptional regulator n=1 Tax=unclassified Sporosarcina TaxID=2647733 RepID=UPI0009BD4B71|nr:MULTISPECIES: IclR family transcriptional regulator [unclassified Sporosarcina]ARD47956.1 hypothetical protein SporoP33_06755 [Sporosarcina sp. P33]ARK24481.1 hypothetical protein SporoP37_07230 [Sporosarcina sp. P37]PID18356.1 IclR family transcriptional regulator [Sporosarcina sp. P35]